MVVESDRDLAVTVIQMMVPVSQKKKGRTVCKEKRAIKTRKKHIIGLLMAENGVEIDRLSVNPAVNAFTGITELKWGTTLEGAEKSVKYYFYLMFPMDSIPSILDYTNTILLAKKKAPLSKRELIKWLGIRLVMAVEPRRGPLPTYWKSESDAGVVSTAANDEGCFDCHGSQISIHVFNWLKNHNL